MIKRKNDLHELIHSMSRTEKRHFRLFSGLYRNEKTDYQLLYNAIQTQSNYNEQQIADSFKDKKFIKNLDIKKHYLYDLILKSLSNYHTDKFKEGTRLFQVELMMSKGLYRQAYTLLETEKKKALSTEKTQLVISTLELELNLHRFYSRRKKEDILNELIFYSARFNRELQFRKLYVLFREGIDQYMFIRSGEQKKKYDKILSSPLIKSNELPMDFISAHSYCVLKFWKYGTMGDWKSSLKYAKMDYKLLSKKENILKDFFQEFIFVYNNLIVSLIKSQNYSQFKKYHQ
jgi:hypothetical protein